MNFASDPASLARLVVFGGLALGVVLGIAGQATRFCIRGAIADWVIFRGPGRLLSWLLALAIGAIGVQVLVSAGLLDATRTLPWSNRLLWLSALVGGLLFGYGMILSGGCPQRCLVKAGSGNLKAAIALVLVAIAAAMTLRGLFAAPRVSLLDASALTLAGPQDLGGLLARWTGASAAVLRWLLAAGVLAVVLAWAWRVRRSVEKSHWIGGIVVGLVLLAAFWLTGHVGFLAEHPETLEPAWLGTQSRRPEGLSFAAPLAGGLELLTWWSDKSIVPTFGVMLAAGVLLGAHVSARLRGEFRLESFSSPRELGEHAAGAVLMGFGGVTALGCSVGNGVTGVALLSSGALLATAGIVAGAWLALRMQARRATAGERVAPAGGEAVSVR